MGFMAGLYGYTPERVGSAKTRVATLLEMLSARIDAQKAGGSSYFVGDSLTAVDLYWACFATMFAPLPNEVCPMSDALRTMYTLDDPILQAALRPPLLAHRDFIYERYLTLPFDF
jgi:glutathione S-transferase